MGGNIQHLGDTTAFLVVCNRAVGAVRPGGGTAGERQVENISLNFTKIEFTVRKLNPDGTLGAPVTITWNIATSSP
jgi:type VI protein secretion system component Hcp